MLVTIYGASGVGKTALSVKLTQQLGLQGHTAVYVSPDLFVPFMGYMFPHWKRSELFSLGEAMNRVDIFPDDLRRAMVCPKANKNVGYLGFKAGEGYGSYPKPTSEKIISVLAHLQEIADVVVVDCVTDPSDLFSLVARANSDVQIRVVSPDPKSVAYFGSCGDEFHADELTKVMTVINCRANDNFIPKNELEVEFGTIDIVVPYCYGLGVQEQTGMMVELLKERGFNNAISAMAKEVIISG